jgi:predicted PurR-regulated permease PerM
MQISFQKTFFVIATIFALFAAMIFAKSILFPFSLALMISFILFPLVKRIEKWGANSIMATFLSLLISSIIIIGFIVLFSTQLIELSSELNDFSAKIMGLFTDLLIFVNKNISFLDDLNREELLKEGQAWLKNSAGLLVGKTVSNTSSFLTGSITILIYSFLILIYRNSLTNAFVKFASQNNKDRVFNMFKNIQQVGQKYLSGMFILIVILGFANSIGLWIIGIDSPFLFGFLAATLSIIPYVGTTLGATIPVLYAFMAYDQLWMPIAVIILFWAVQLIESNFLSPKIVGSSLNVNPLAAILSLIIGAAVWGIAGMVLFLPFAAMLKVFCDQFEELRPVAMLINNHDEADKEEGSKLSKKIASWFSRSS